MTVPARPRISVILSRPRDTAVSYTHLDVYKRQTQEDAGRLMTLVGSLRFCQVVDPQITVRFEFPKSVLVGLGFAGIACKA